MGMYRIMATLQSQTGLPRDRFVNTYYVNTIVPFADVPGSLLQINNLVGAFYTAIGFALSPEISHTDNTVKAYDMSLPPHGRVPISPVTFPITPASSPLPDEVALVLTLEGTPQPGVLPQSTRGRVFLGPLGASMIGSGGPNDSSRPNATGIQSILNAAVTMVQGIDGVGNASLVVASTRQDKAELPAGSRQAYPVINVSIDNAWDTQRSRGNRPSTRNRANVATPPGLPRSW